MNFARIRPGDAVTGALGLVLLVSLSLDWYARPQGGASAWAAFGVLDLLLALVALLALSVPVVTAGRATPAWPVALLDLVLAFAFLSGLFLLYRLIDQPGQDDATGADAGVWIGSLALLATFVSAAFALRDERAPGIAEPREIPVMPAPAREAAGSGRSPDLS